MMKNEWSPIRSSKKDVKRRLDNLFGEYSHFAVRPDYQQSQLNQMGKNASTEGSAASTNLRDHSHHSIKLESEDTIAISHDKYAQDQTRSNLDSLIGELVNVSKPLSPVSIKSTPTKMESVAADLQEQEVPANGKNGMKSTMDLKVLLEQISRVSPLLSPINLDLNEDEHQKKVDTELGKRKRIDDAEDSNDSSVKHFKIGSEQYSHRHNNTKNLKTDDKTTYYSIKLNNEAFHKLIQKFKNSISKNQNSGHANGVLLVTEDECVKWARQLFDELYHHEVVKSRHDFSHDRVEKCSLQAMHSPQPLHFNVEDEEHLNFVHSASILRAHVYGLQPIRDRQKVAQMAFSYESPSAAWR